MKTKKKSKSKDTSELEYDNDAEHFIFKHLKIGADGNLWWLQRRKERLSKLKFCAERRFCHNKSYSVYKIFYTMKKLKTKHYARVLLGEMNCWLGKANFCFLKITLDFIAISSILPGKQMQKLRKKKNTPVIWKNQGGEF